ncbi:MAG: hypothetical protein ACREBE_01330 [bacterium]
MSSLDEEIREHFADLHTEDSARAPQFSELWREAERRALMLARRRRVARASWLAVAASVLFAATLVLRAPGRGNEPIQASIVDPAVYPNILSWTPPTDGLLRTAERSAAVSPATFGSILDRAANDSVPPDSFK